jgi:hypothetical protein
MEIPSSKRLKREEDDTKKTDRHKIVVAIDYGTTGTGKSAPQDIAIQLTSLKLSHGQ